MSESAELRRLFEPVKKVLDASPSDRRAVLVSVYSASELSYWATAVLLAQMDTMRDWCDGHQDMWTWFCDFIEGNGFTRPDNSEYHAFRMQVRNGRFWIRCQNLGINPELLLSIGRSKVDIIARNTQDRDKIEIEVALHRAVELNRADVHRLFSVDARRPSQQKSPNENAGVLRRDLSEPSKDAPGAQMFDASQEPEAPAPIPDDDRPSAVTRITCPCGRTHVVAGTIDEFWTEDERP